MLFILRTFVILLAVGALVSVTAAKKEAAPAPSSLKNADSGKATNPTSNKHSEPIIEDVTSKQLEKVLNEKDYVAVFWCKYLSLLCIAQPTLPASRTSKMHARSRYRANDTERTAQ